MPMRGCAHLNTEGFSSVTRNDPSVQLPCTLPADKSRHPSRSRALFAFALGIALANIAITSHSQSKEPAFTSESERCILQAAQYQSVNPHVLRAILRVESALNPGAVGRNTNGTVDIGIGQINSIHLKELSKYGIGPNHLLDACVGTYVAAWHLKRVSASGGNTWESIAKYHSGNPYYNRRYQILLFNELVKSGVISGTVQPVPPLNANTQPPGRGTPTKGKENTGTVVVFDSGGIR